MARGFFIKLLSIILVCIILFMICCFLICLGSCEAVLILLFSKNLYVLLLTTVESFSTEKSKVVMFTGLAFAVKSSFASVGFDGLIVKLYRNILTVCCFSSCVARIVFFFRRELESLRETTSSYSLYL